MTAEELLAEILAELEVIGPMIEDVLAAQVLLRGSFVLLFVSLAGAFIWKEWLTRVSDPD